jgi:hypothetical protein
MVEPGCRRCGVLSAQEERIWEDVQRYWEGGVDEPGATDEAPGFAMVGIRVAIVLVLFGAVVPGMLVTAASLIGWAVWRRRRDLVATARLPVDREGSSVP